MVTTLPLDGLKVVDLATLFAGPLVATTLGDFGADVIKVEHPKGDSLRSLGATKDGHALWWKIVGRNKRSITLDLHDSRGVDVLLDLIADADVLVENFRPGQLDAFGATAERIFARNPGLIILRTTGFGQTGPYRGRPGYGTLAEAFSGFSYVTGPPEGPPTLAPFGLADGVAALTGTYAVMIALYERDHHSGRGQEIDLSLYEPLFSLLGSMPAVFQQLGVIQQPRGNRSVNNSPRNTYKTQDNHWVAVSTAAPSTFERLMRLVGRPDLADDPLLKGGGERVKHADELDTVVSNYTEAHTLADILAAFEEVGAAVAPVYDIAQIFQDPQYQERETIVEVQDPDLGYLAMANVIPHLVRSPGTVRWTGPALGSSTRQVLSEKLSYSDEKIQSLCDGLVISCGDDNG